MILESENLVISDNIPAKLCTKVLAYRDASWRQPVLQSDRGGQEV